jgi:ATP-dependent exoDNAse (exonuclease V) beta subunit
VCILFRRLSSWGKDVSRSYARSLELRRVPHVLVGGRSFHLREEITALRTALWAIERPEDELSVYATLKGPFFGLSDDALLTFRHAEGRLHPLKRREVGGLSNALREVADSLEILRSLHLRRNQQSVAVTMTELLEATRAYAGVAFWRAGDQALANLLQLTEQAARSERTTTSFRAVLEALDDEADEGDSADAPLVEEGTEGVRMMTVHAAKGLEFPVVVLAEPTGNIAPKNPSHWVDARGRLWAESLAGCVPAELREREAEAKALDVEEAVRLTYVAATRARDMLVVPAVADKRFPDTWTSVLYPALYPAIGAEGRAAPSPGCPAFGSDTVVDRSGRRPADSPVPGLHRAQTGTNDVVWWDPATLQLSVEDHAGLEREIALVSGDASAAEASQLRWETWRVERERLLASGSEPSLSIRVARDLTKPERPGGVIFDDSVPRTAGRPKGRRFGALVHAVLAQVALNADRQDVSSLAKLEARALLASEEEEAAAVDAVEAALGHPLLRQAAALRIEAVRREASVSKPLADGTLFEGTVDLAFNTGAEWVVVEIKTDEEIGLHRAQYEAQTEAYVDAISAATGKPARGVVLSI